MARLAVITLGLSLAAGLAVALVQAQETSHRRQWQDGDTNESSAADAGAPSNTVRPRGSLADRLKAVRGGGSQGSPFSQGGETLTPAAGGDNSFTQNPVPQNPVRVTPMETNAAPTSGATDSSRSSFSPAQRAAPTEAGSHQGGSFLLAPTDESGGNAQALEAVQSVLKRQQAAQQQQPNVSSPGDATPRTALRADEENASSRRNAFRDDSALTPSDTTSSRNGWRQEDFTRTARSPYANRGIPPESLHLTSTGPAIRVETIGPKSVAVGQEATYTIRLANAGAEAAREMNVTVDLPAWVQVVAGDVSVGRTDQENGTGTVGRIVWSIDALAARATEEFQLTVVPRDSRTFSLDVNWRFAPPPTSATVEVLEPQLQVAVLGPDDVLFGKPTTYKIVLSNPGTGRAEHVAVSLAPLSPGGGERSMQQVGGLDAGETRELQIEVTPRDQGGLTLQVEATADGELRTEAARQVRVRRPELQLAAKGPALKYAGTSATYQVSVVNAGDAAAENVQVDLRLPAGAKYVGGVASARVSSRGITWSLGRLAAGGNQTFDVQCEMQVAGDVKLEVSAEADGGLAASQVVATRVEAIADVKLTVRDPQGPKAVGADAVYELTIVNRGSKEARGISAVVQFSEGIEPVSADGHQAEVVPGQVVFATIDRLEPGQEKTLRVTARAQTAGNHVFRCEVRCTEPETRRVSEGTTRFFQADGPAGAAPSTGGPSFGGSTRGSSFNLGRRP